MSITGDPACDGNTCVLGHDSNVGAKAAGRTLVLLTPQPILVTRPCDGEASEANSLRAASISRSYESMEGIMKPKRWVGILSAGAVLATGIAAWAAGSESSVVRSAAPSLVAGRDLTDVSAPPGLTNSAGDEGDASKASGPPRKSLRSLA